MRGRRAGDRLAGSALLAVVLLAGCEQPRPDVGIAPGLNPKLTPAAAEQLARDAFASSEAGWPGRREAPDVTSITAIRGGPTVGGYLAGVSWIVRATGDFEVRSCRRCSASETTMHGVIVQISDDDGSVVALNFSD